MKIAASSLAFTSQHSANSNFQATESLHAWIGPSRPDSQERQARRSSPSAPSPSISPAAYQAQAREQPSSSSSAQSINDAFDKANHDPVLQLIRAMLEMLTGQAFQIFYDEVLAGSGTPNDATPPPSSPAPAQAMQASGSAGFGIEYDRHQVFTETEQTHFQAEGSIRTTDGKEIRFQLQLDMQRSHTEETSLSLRAGDARKKDPLVINFGGTAAQLQSQRFKFDLMGNGNNLAIPMLVGNSGYLALDLNRNGKLDSGKELFGPASGNGFADLARYDSDGNGWIDEGDSAFNELRIWTPGAPSGDTLTSLRDRQVGALFLGKQATPFDLRDGSNDSLGSVRSSGIYLGDDGSSGTLQQIDLNV